MYLYLKIRKFLIYFRIFKYLIIKFFAIFFYCFIFINKNVDKIFVIFSGKKKMNSKIKQ